MQFKTGLSHPKCFCIKQKMLPCAQFIIHNAKQSYSRIQVGVGNDRMFEVLIKLPVLLIGPILYQSSYQFLTVEKVVFRLLISTYAIIHYYGGHNALLEFCK